MAEGTTQRGTGATGTGALDASRRATAQLAELTGRAADSVSELSRTDDGWCFHVEIVELARIPGSTSVLGSYEVDADADGNVTSYRRLRRYTRNQAGGESR